MDLFDVHQEPPFKLFVVLGKMNKVLQTKLNHHFAEHGLTSTEFMVLDALWTHGKLPIQEIGSIVLITSGGITHILNGLEKKELILRIQSENDKRKFYVQLTEPGISFWKEFVPKHKDFVTSLFSNFDKTKLNQLIDLIKELGYYITLYKED